MIYVKNGIHCKRRHDLELRGIESIWIELVQNHKSILYGLFYRPPNANAQYFLNIEDSVALAIDTGVSDVIVTVDFNFNFLNSQSRRKIDTLCTQFSLYQSISQPTHYTEYSSSLICNSCGLCSDGLAFILMIICNFGCLLAHIYRFYTYFWFAGYQAWFGRFHLL